MFGAPGESIPDRLLDEPSFRISASIAQLPQPMSRIEPLGGIDRAARIMGGNTIL
jgi:hypothetical protein